MAEMCKKPLMSKSKEKDDLLCSVDEKLIQWTTKFNWNLWNDKQQLKLHQKNLERANNRKH